MLDFARAAAVSTSKWCLGIDLGGSSIKLALVGSRCDPVTLGSREYRRPQLLQLGDCLGEAFDALCGSVAIKAASIGAACLSVPGPMDVDGVVTAASNLPALVGLKVADWAQKQLHLCCRLSAISEPLAAAMGENRLRPCAGRALYLSIGSGVGGVVLEGGQPLGPAGHFGHIDVSGGEIDAPSGVGCGRGALEAYIGAWSLRDAGVDLESPKRFEHLAMRRGVAALARALRTLLMLYLPGRIVLLGGVGSSLGPALAQLNHLVRDGLGPAAPRCFEIACGRSDRFGAALGTAWAAAAFR